MFSNPEAGSRHISWEQLQGRIAEGVPFVHRIPSPAPPNPAVDIRVSEGGEELSLWIPCTSSGKLMTSPLAEMDVGFVYPPSGQVIQIKTRSSVLFQEMYNFFVSISDKIQLDGADPFAALEETLANWRELLKARSILSDKAQLGLRGELFFLRRLIEAMGDSSLDAWTGPRSQPHDFRVGETEFEVKTTQGTSHSHIINGLEQLQPSPDHTLYIVSLCMSPAGLNAGSTLPGDVESTRALLSPVARVHFDRVLEQYFKYRRDHEIYYRDNLQIADVPILVAVDEACPRLTRFLLSNIPHMERMSDVHYRVNLEGLGFKSGTAEYEAILPQPSSGKGSNI